MKRSPVHAVLALVLGFALAPRPATAAVCTQPGQFGPATDIHTGPNPLFTVAADFNHDGLIDLAVTNSAWTTLDPVGHVAILLGTGPLTFAPPVLYAVGSVPHALLAGDFNGDGILDLAVANKFSSSISILIGQGTGGFGDGTFAPAVSYPTGGYPFQLVAGDFNGDGALDLATAINDTGGVSVLLGHVAGGHGDGTFGPFVKYPLLSISTGIAMGDFNHDGVLDLVATENSNHTIAVLLGHATAGHGDGTFNPAAHYAAGPEPFHVAVGDFNGDGVKDLAIANTSSGGTAILLGNGLPNAGNGTFAAPTFLASGNSACVSTGDVNGDGISDLMVGTATGADGGGLLVYLGNGSGGVGDGTFGPPTPYVFASDTYQILPKDLDGDGKLDMVYTAYNDDFIGVLHGTCTAPPPDLRKPVLTHVNDVPLDQGGKVFVTWTASSLDVLHGPVVQYRVWRRIPTWLSARQSGGAGTTAALRTVRPAGPNSTAVTYWEALATLPAQRLAGYGYTAATVSDSSADGNPYTAFYVSALTSSIDDFYDSGVDSGYSVDNIAPDEPKGLVAQAMAGPAIGLHWLPSSDADFAGYRLYRGDDSQFATTPGTLIAAPRDTGYIDLTPGAHWYKLAAVDTHGNESAVAAVSASSTTGVGGGGELAFALYGARPNPSPGDAIAIAFSLPVAGQARLTVLNVAGRTVLERTLPAAPAGPQAVSFAGAPKLRDGVYLVRLTQGARSAVVKAVIRN